MILKELSVDSGCYYDHGEIEARFSLNKDEFYIISKNKNIVYSLGKGGFVNIGGKDMNKNNVRVIYNNPVTILYMNGKKYISKAHEENFDEEKGLLMCLAKANGISHSELKRMIKNAKWQTLPQKERKSINGVSVNRYKITANIVKRPESIPSTEEYEKGLYKKLYDLE